nr:TolC family outer membrane protein [uncultured Lichenicoccus sp.]
MNAPPPRLARLTLLVGLIAAAPHAARAETAPAIQLPPSPMSLMQALDATYDGNPRLLAARAQLRQTDEGVPTALAGWRPRLYLEGQIGLGVYQNRSDTLHYPEHRAPQDYELSLTQTLYASGRVSDALAIAKVRVLAQRATLAASEQQVLLAAGSAYLDVVRDREILRLDSREEAVLARTLRANGVELAAGDITQADVAQSEARLDRQRAATAAAAAEVTAAEAAFEDTVGVQPGDVVLPETDFNLPATETEALGLAQDANPALQAAHHLLEASRLGVDLARDQLLPLVTLNGLLERQRQYEYDLYSQSVNVAQALVQLTVPIYQGGAAFSAVRQAKEGNVQAQELVDQASRDATQSVRTAWARMLAARERVLDEGRATGSDRLAEQGLAGQQSVGARTTIDLLNAQQETLSSEVAKITARTDLLTAELMLLDATGGLTLEQLDGAHPRYDPRAHYRAVRSQWLGTSPPHEDRVWPIASPRPGDIGQCEISLARPAWPRCLRHDCSRGGAAGGGGHGLARSWSLRRDASRGAADDPCQRPGPPQREHPVREQR